MINVVIDNACLGTFRLVDVVPDFYGSSTERQKDPQGYKYDVLMPDQKSEKILIKIPGKQLMEVPLSGHEPTVEFEGLVIKPYVDRNGRLAFSATATGIKVVDANGKTQAKG